MQIIVLGPPGVGKGTQSLLLADKLGLKHLSTGEILRRAVHEETELGLKVKEIMEKGELISDDIMIDIIREALTKLEMKNGFILDGFPRTLKQAIALDKLFAELKFNDLKVINFTADKDELIKRLKGRGRKDDSIETIENRLKVYREQTAPVKQYYEQKFKVFDVHGVGNITEINDNLMKVLTRSVTV